MNYSILCLNCDRFTIEILGIEVVTNQRDLNHDVVLDFKHHDYCKTTELDDKLSKFGKDNLEAVFCRFPVESYIGSILKNKYISDRQSYRNRKIEIIQDSTSINTEQLEDYTERLSFQYLDTRIIISNPKYRTQFENATLPRGDRSDFEKSLISSAAIAYRTVWNYHRGRNRNSAIWTF